MSFGSLKDVIVLNSFLNEVKIDPDREKTEKSFINTIAMIREEFPSLTEDESLRILNILAQMYNQINNEKIDLVITAPASFNLRTKRTDNVVEEMLASSKKSILMTGYSVSQYIKDFIDIIIEKSQKGVFVKLFINKIEEQGGIDKLIDYQGRFLKIYNYTDEKDKMSALHAKVISVDNYKTLISSANMSYHGMEANIEIGCLIQSQQIAKKIREVFEKLIFKKIFREAE